jgi:hypothetical protein
LDALAEALRTDGGWLEYRLQVVRDELLEQDAQAVEDVSVVAKVQTALLERDEALQKAREDAAAMRTVATEWETEVASLRAQLEQGRATLEGARSWQSQAEERAKEAEQLRASLADKAASLASTEEQFQRVRDARQQADAQLQQERAALDEAREEAQGRLQQEHIALEGRRQPSRSGTTKSRGSTGSSTSSVSRTRICASPSRSRKPRFLACSRRMRTRARPLNQRGNRLKVSCFFPLLACCFGLLGICSQFSFFVRGFQACGMLWGT